MINFLYLILFLVLILFLLVLSYSPYIKNNQKKLDEKREEYDYINNFLTNSENENKKILFSSRIISLDIEMNRLEDEKDKLYKLVSKSMVSIVLIFIFLCVNYKSLNIVFTDLFQFKIFDFGFLSDKKILSVAGAIGVGVGLVSFLEYPARRFVKIIQRILNNSKLFATIMFSIMVIGLLSVYIYSGRDIMTMIGSILATIASILNLLTRKVVDNTNKKKDAYEKAVANFNKNKIKKDPFDKKSNGSHNNKD